MASPRLRLGELLRLGPMALWRERALLALPLINALLPGAALRAGLRRIAVRTRWSISAEPRAQRFAAAGPAAGPAAAAADRARAPLLPPPVAAEPFRVGYFGPPLAARGADLALAAFEAARALGLDGRLLLLLRPDSGERQPRTLSRPGRAQPLPRRDRLPGRTCWRPATLRRELAACHAFILPFRAPVSEVPLAVIEAGSVRPADHRPAGPRRRRVRPRVRRDRRVATPADLPDALLAAAAAPAARDHRIASRLDRLARRPWRRCSTRQPPASPATGWWRWPASTAAARPSCCTRCSAASTAAGVPHRHVWSRFRNYLSKPLLALARLTGHNRKEELGTASAPAITISSAAPGWPGRSCASRWSTLVLDGWWRYHRRR